MIIGANSYRLLRRYTGGIAVSKCKTNCESHPCALHYGGSLYILQQIKVAMCKTKVQFAKSHLSCALLICLSGTVTRQPFITR